MRRPCDHPNAPNARPGDYSPGQCWVCWLSLNVPEYAELFGEPPPADPRPMPLGKRSRVGWGDLAAWLIRRTGLAWLFGRSAGCGPCAGRREAMNRWPTPADLWHRITHWRHRHG